MSLRRRERECEGFHSVFWGLSFVFSLFSLLFTVRLLPAFFQKNNIKSLNCFSQSGGTLVPVSPLLAPPLVRRTQLRVRRILSFSVWGIEPNVRRTVSTIRRTLGP